MSIVAAFAIIFGVATLLLILMAILFLVCLRAKAIK